MMASSARTVRARLMLPAVACLLWLVPSTASAQCWYEAGLYADLYDNGVDAVEVYGAGWDSSYCPPCGHTYQLDATLWFNSAVVDNQSYSSPEVTASYYTIYPGWVSFEVTFEIFCSCGGAIPVGQVGGSQQVQRFGPPSAEITMRSFIRDEHVPSLVLSDVFFWGDNRSFCSTCGTHRLGLWLQVNNPQLSSQIFPSPVDIDSSLTAAFDVHTSLDGEDHITPAARADWVHGWPMKLNWAYADGSQSACAGEQHSANTVQVRCLGMASDPLIAFAPNLDFEFTIDLSFSANGIEYTITGCHDSFPDYEIWINDFPALTDAATGGLLGVVPICGVEIPVHAGVVLP